MSDSRIERKHTMTMHDDRVNCITYNAFNGLGDTTGSDEFGYSVAWLDLNDHLEPEGLDHHELYPYSDDVSEYVKTLPELAGGTCHGNNEPHRYMLAYWQADGQRSVVAYCSRDDMMIAYRAIESEYNAFEEV